MRTIHMIAASTRAALARGLRNSKDIFCRAKTEFAIPKTDLRIPKAKFAKRKEKLLILIAAKDADFFTQVVVNFENCRIAMLRPLLSSF